VSLKGRVAVIEIGSTGIRLVIAEIDPKGLWRVVDRAGKPLSLGRDVFTTGIISRESLLNCLAVLDGFQELIVGWGIVRQDVHVIATSALREARNRDTFSTGLPPDRLPHKHRRRNRREPAHVPGRPLRPEG
jgi:exopolyphosphatase/guanosine-5'-triphosphate,3'-diphosphate pyrophosphatase